MINKIVMTGEGPTDMGCCRNQQPICCGNDLELGPMAGLLWKLLCHHLPDWNVDCLDQAKPEGYMILISGAELGNISKRRSRIRPGKKNPELKGFLVHTQHAEALAQYAKDKDCQLAAYFHDVDRTDGQCLHEAIKTGFRAAEFETTGLALTPKPTSEAWLICGVKANAYQHCEQLENTLSGNDRSTQHAPKEELARCLGKPDYNRTDLNNLVEQLDIARLNMPSFNELREQVKTAIAILCCQCRD